MYGDNIVKVKQITESLIPTYETKGSAGADLRSVSDDYTLAPGEKKLFQTGIKVQLPENSEMQIRSKSGLALKHGVVVLNSPGTIDSDYRGEIGVILINHGDIPFKVNKGSKVAQMVFNYFSKANFKPVKELDTTERGEDGYGSTGR